MDFPRNWMRRKKRQKASNIQDSAAMNSDGKPPSTHQPSLPAEIVVSCLARVSRSYYPNLCLVSKTFRSLILSSELSHARAHFKTKENVLCVCLQLPNRRLPSWFSLWIKPDQTLTNEFDVNNKSSGNSLLVPLPSSYFPRVTTIFHGLVDSKIYAMSQSNANEPSFVMWVRNEGTYPAWLKAPPMRVTRENDAVVEVLDGKIYVMGGCSPVESTNWAEVFDTKTQTWESLPDPGVLLRFSLIKDLNVQKGKIYVSNSTNQYYVYDPKERRWDVTKTVTRTCGINNVSYFCGRNGCSWYDKKCKVWRVVKGLEVFNMNCCEDIQYELVNYGRKLLILWDKFEKPDDSLNKNIWCSVIVLEKRDDDEVWGNVEWTNVVLTVPSSYVFLRCKLMRV